MIKVKFASRLTFDLMVKLQRSVEPDSSFLTDVLFVRKPSTFDRLQTRVRPDRERQQRLGRPLFNTDSVFIHSLFKLYNETQRFLQILHI